MNCNICPRECNKDRVNDFGFCRMQEAFVLSRAALHLWEEPCIAGDFGSGTIFFAGCNLNCIYCQNYDISKEGFGKEVNDGRLLEIMFSLKEKGAANINLVTPSHYAKRLIPVIKRAKDENIGIPFVYNTSAYEKVETLKELEGLIDVYMPDFKYMSEKVAFEYSNAKDYPSVAKAAIDEMVRQKGKIKWNNDLMTEGVLIRHLLLPGMLEDSKRVMEYLYNRYGEKVYFSIMSQYTPTENVKNHPLLSRKVKEDEYDELVDFCVEMGMENAFTQEGEAASESFIPPFTLEGI